MGAPKKNKQLREEKGSEQAIYESAATSEFSLMIPMKNAKFVRFKHPYTKLDIHCATDSQLFLDTFRELSSKGLQTKLVKELWSFAHDLDERWMQVLKFVGTETPQSVETANLLLHEVQTVVPHG